MKKIGLLITSFIVCWGVLLQAQNEIHVISVNSSWNMPTAATVSAQIKAKKQTPALLLTEPSLIAQKIFADNKILADVTFISEEARKEFPVRHNVKNHPTIAAISLGKKYWTTSPIVIVAMLQDTGAVIQGAALAAHKRVPFIPINSSQDITSIKRFLKHLKTKQVWVATHSAPPVWLKNLSKNIRVINQANLQKLQIAVLGKDKIKNIIVTSAPFYGSSQKIDDCKAYYHSPAVLAPYLSLMRNAPVIIATSSNAEEVEAQIYEVIQQHDIEPRSLTILADYGMIGVTTISIASELEVYEVDIEPCAFSSDGTACTLGVGRLPCDLIEDSSLMIFYGLFRNHIMQQQDKIVMVSNPPTEYGGMPLAETISRANSEEFKNKNLRVEEFYNTHSDEVKVIEAAKDASLIIYEGHIIDQFLFAPDRQFLEDDSEENGSPEENQGTEHEHDETNSENSSENENPYDPNPANPYDPEHYKDHEDYPVDENGNPLRPSTEFNEDENNGFLDDGWRPVDRNYERGRIERLPNHALVILQSCTSLETEVLNDVIALQGVGMIGTSCTVHSGSGSSFIKAFSDEILYRGSTVGEALRDTRNYFLCLAQLKSKRGHKETAKVNRVAMSFRLWGDPEMELFPKPLDKAKNEPVKISFSKNNDIVITTPEKNLPKSESEKYFTKMFPGSYVAGLVKSIKNKETRRIMPLYFSRLDIPENFDLKKFKALRREGDETQRAAYVVDRYNKHLYVLYFPKEVEKDTELHLKFIE